MKNLIFIIAVILLLSCRKEDDSNPKFSYVDIEDAYGFAIGKFPTAEFELQKFYKINKTDHLVEVKYLDDNKNELKNKFVPVAMYDLNKTYFLITFSNIHKTEFESYLIRRVDGLAQKLSKPVVVESSGITDMNIHAIRSDNNFGNYFLNSQGNWKVNLLDVTISTHNDFLKGEILDNYFTVDYLGNVLTSKKAYSINGNSKTLEWANIDYTYPLRSTINSMYYVFRKGDSVQCAQIDVSSGNLTEKKLYPSVLLNTEQASFIGSHAFAGFNKTIVVMGAAILQIEGSTVSKTDLIKLNLSKIYAAEFSGKFCFIYGDNPVGYKVFVKLDMKGVNPVYTQILAPNDVEIKNFSASVDDNLVFSGKRISNNKPIIGYIPFTGSNWIYDNDDLIEDLQVLVR
jgi:hypothetical protein